MLHVVYTVGDLDKTIKYNTNFLQGLYSYANYWMFIMRKSLKVVVFLIVLLSVCAYIGFTQNVWKWNFHEEKKFRFEL